MTKNGSGVEVGHSAGVRNGAVIGHGTGIEHRTPDGEGNGAGMSMGTN